MSLCKFLVVWSLYSSFQRMQVHISIILYEDIYFHPKGYIKEKSDCQFKNPAELVWKQK